VNGAMRERWEAEGSALCTCITIRFVDCCTSVFQLLSECLFTARAMLELQALY